METDARGGSQFRRDAVALQENLVITGLNNFAVMRKGRRGGREPFLRLKFTGHWHHGHTVNLPAVDMAEALDVRLAVNIAGEPVAINLCVGTQTDHPERPARGRKINPARLVRVNQRIDVVCRTFFSGGDGNGGQE